MEVYLGSIILFAGNFQIRGFALCDGRLIQISQNTALFSILGTTYGGNGTSTFALPDLRGRVPIHYGQGSGLSPYVLGQSSGAETVTLTTQQIPSHSHLVNVSNAAGTTSVSSGNYLAETAIAGSRTGGQTYSAASGAQLNPLAITSTGGSQAHPNLQPYLALSFQIALQGIFPSRS